MTATESPHFDAPPLKEAVFDLFAQASSDAVPDDELRRLEEEFFAVLPDIREHHEPWRQTEAAWQLGGGRAEGPTATLERTAVRRWDHARTRGVLFGPSVLAFNVLPPYGHFKDHLPRLREIHAAYLRLRPAAQPLWLGHRFINQVLLEIDEGVLPSELFLLYPRLTEKEAARHPPLTVRLEAARFENGVVIASLALAAADRRRAVYVLDLYARTVESVPKSVDSIVEWHERAHEEVVNAFLLSLTERARQRFKERKCSTLP